MDVGEWLRELGLGQYEATFRDNGIDGLLLPHLTVEDLRELGVAGVGDRRRLLVAIEALASPERAPSSTVSGTVGDVAAERRPIAVMFCDLVGSTRLAASMDAEDWRNLVGAYLNSASEAVTGLGGHVAKRLGDGLMALFGFPIAQENDAERAVRAALAIQRALADLNARGARTGASELSARIGIESGPVVVDATGEVFGEAPNVAARVQAAAAPGTVLVTATVQRLVAGLFVAEDKGAHDLKGLPTALTLFRIVRASGGGRLGGGRILTSLVGREDELSILQRCWARTVEGEGQFVHVVGEPGIGKSRLIDALREKLAETPHTWIEWSASQLLQNTPLHPLAEWGRQRFGGPEVPAERRLADLKNALSQLNLDPAEHALALAPALDIPLPPDGGAQLSSEELRRRQLAAMTAWFLAGARTQPVVLAFEDLHWADPTSLDLLRVFAELGAQAPLFVVATTRPEFRAPWGVLPHHGVITLAPLDRGQVRRMALEIASRHPLADEVIDRLAERTGGVPLFVEEVTRLLLERGEEGGVAQVIPPTLQQSLAARLDRLGPARELAQISSVLGRDFSYRQLSDVSGFEKTALLASLERLVEADLLFVNGAPPEAAYRFKHALIQDAAYDSLLRSRRQALHRRAAEILRDDPERAAAAPEVVARHFTQAGLDDAAIEWWGKAGDQALRRSAFQEAIAHLGNAIDLADRAAGGPAARVAEVHEGRVKLQSDYAQALLWSKGFAADETLAAFERAGDLASGARLPGERFPALFGRCVRRQLRGDIRGAREIAEVFLREAEEGNRPMEAGVGRRLVGLIHIYQGDLDEAQSCLELALNAYVPERDSAARERFAHDTSVAARAFLALVACLRGDFPRACAMISAAIVAGHELGHLPSAIHAMWYRIYIAFLRDDPRAVAGDAEDLLRISRQHGAELFVLMASIALGWARGRLDDLRAGARQLETALADYRSKGNRLWVPTFLALWAELEAAAGDPQRALALIDEAIATARDRGERFTDAFLHRLRGQFLLGHDPADTTAAEDAFKTARAVAERQGAHGFALQASLALAELYRKSGRAAEAYVVLAPALDGSAPPPDMPETGEAWALLASLAETKSGAVRSRRMSQLQVAYGNALIAARGFGAPETTRAFLRARETALGGKAAPERLAADYGLWAGSFARGELPAMREFAATFLRDVGSRPDSPEAGVAHRVLGTTHWCAGEFAEARDHLEHALALFEPSRDDDLALRFGHDPGVVAMLHLAFTMWSLGEVDRAISFVGEADARAARLDHVGTHAFQRMHAAGFWLMHGDMPRAVQNAIQLASLSGEHDLPTWRAYAVFLEGLAKAQSGGPGAGLADMRRGADLLREQHLSHHGLIKVSLAEAEAGAGDLDRAVAILDEALATSDRIGYRSFDAELHRTRGDMLLRRDAASRDAAEKALQTSVALAQRQCARGFELRAALSLAKLYQSNARPVEAHSVLAPALTGLSATPEMPEISEAKELLAALADRPAGNGSARRE